MSSSLDGAFSFDTPQAVMHVLASVRHSDVSVNDKNNLRDLILSYTNAGKDPSLKIQIEQQLARLAIQPAPVAAPVAPVVPLEFGSYRSAPIFAAPASAPTVAKPAAQPVVPSAYAAAVAPVTPPAPAPVSVVEPAPMVAEPVLTVAQPMTAPIPTTPPVAEQTPVPSADATDSATALARVREIKALVNEKIGNPVNLVDIDNQVGREYMSALLDAMKKLSSGSSDAATIDRLESAYAAVERVLANTPNKDVVPTAPTPTPTPAPAPTPTITRLEVEPVIPTPPTPVASTPPPKVEPEPVAAPVIPTKKVVQPPRIVAPQPAVPARAATMPMKDDRWQAASAAIKPASIRPLSESAPPLKSLNDVPTQDSLTNKNADPLMEAEVTDGLNQLLTDWVLFKKSGLFGTGPKGIEHALYKNIKDLQIPLLLAGRFEGATQEIKQSITDYMNGWRYEQGIIYEQGETFDHYLRRVIRHILDLQK